jgi:hypothetical protein
MQQKNHILATNEDFEFPMSEVVGKEAARYWKREGLIHS